MHPRAFVSTVALRRRVVPEKPAGLQHALSLIDREHDPNTEWHTSPIYLTSSIWFDGAPLNQSDSRTHLTFAISLQQKHTVQSHSTASQTVGAIIEIDQPVEL